MKHRKKFSRYEKFIRIIIVASAIVLFWRGVWGIADVLLFPDNYLASSFISLIAGITILALTHESFKDLL